MFNFNSDNYGKHINIHGQVSDALKAYDYNNDKVGTPNFVDSQSLLANVFVTIATPETATQYDERRQHEGDVDYEQVHQCSPRSSNGTLHELDVCLRRCGYAKNDECNA